MSCFTDRVARFTSTLVAAAVLTAVPTAMAENLNLNSIESASTHGLGSFDALICYDVVSPTKGKLTVKLTNLSETEYPLYITGFAFNFESGDPCAKAKLACAPNWVWNKFQGCVPGFGSFKAGATLGYICCDWLPCKAIPIGGCGTFVFNIIATDAGSLTAQNFGAGPNLYDFIVRFKGGCGTGAKDLVPGGDGCVYSGPADLNGNGLISYADVQIVLDNFNLTGPNVADLNGDEIVDGFDLAIVLEAWRDCSIAG